MAQVLRRGTRGADGVGAAGGLRPGVSARGAGGLLAGGPGADGAGRLGCGPAAGGRGRAAGTGAGVRERGPGIDGSGRPGVAGELAGGVRVAVRGADGGPGGQRSGAWPAAQVDGGARARMAPGGEAAPVLSVVFSRIQTDRPYARLLVEIGWCFKITPFFLKFGFILENFRMAHTERGNIDPLS